MDRFGDLIVVALDRHSTAARHRERAASPIVALPKTRPPPTLPRPRQEKRPHDLGPWRIRADLGQRGATATGAANKPRSAVHPPWPFVGDRYWTTAPARHGYAASRRLSFPDASLELGCFRPSFGFWVACRGWRPGFAAVALASRLWVRSTRFGIRPPIGQGAGPRYTSPAGCGVAVRSRGRPAWDAAGRARLCRQAPTSHSSKNTVSPLRPAERWTTL